MNSEFICEYCNKHFSSRTSLSKHKSTASYCIKNRKNIEKDVSKLSCESCMKKFTRKDLLKRHEKVCGSIVKLTVEEKEYQITQLFEKITNDYESRILYLEEEM